MRTFEVAMPITGVVYATIECESDDEDAIYEAFCEQWDGDKPDEWDFTPHVTKGNVTYAHINDIEIDEVTEVDK